jgi:hypothetical protein
VIAVPLCENQLGCSILGLVYFYVSLRCGSGTNYLHRKTSAGLTANFLDKQPKGLQLQSAAYFFSKQTLQFCQYLIQTDFEN